MSACETMIMPRGAVIHFDGIPLRLAHDTVVEGNWVNWHLVYDRINGTAWNHTKYEPEAHG